MQTEVADNRQPEVIDNRLYAIQGCAIQSDKDAQRLITAGVVHTLIKLLKSRAADGVGLEAVLATLGILSRVPSLFPLIAVIVNVVSFVSAESTR